MQKKECSVCGKTMRDWRDERGGLPYWVCEGCGLVQMREEEWVSVEQEKARYETHNNTPENEGYVRMFEEFLAEIEPYTRNVRRVLDFGCGPGPVLAEMMRKKGWEVDVYDPFFAPGEGWQAKKYDLVVCTEVFEHLKEPMKEMWKLAGVLSVRGVLVVMTRFYPREEGLFREWWYRRDETHVSFFTPLTLARMASECGLGMVMTDGEKVVVLEKK